MNITGHEYLLFMEERKVFIREFNVHLGIYRYQASWSQRSNDESIVEWFNQVLVALSNSLHTVLLLDS